MGPLSSRKHSRIIALRCFALCNLGENSRGSFLSSAVNQALELAASYSNSFSKVATAINFVHSFFTNSITVRMSQDLRIQTSPLPIRGRSKQEPDATSRIALYGGWFCSFTELRHAQCCKRGSDGLSVSLTKILWTQGN